MPSDRAASSSAIRTDSGAAAPYTGKPYVRKMRSSPHASTVLASYVDEVIDLKEHPMTKVSRSTAENVKDFGVAEDRTSTPDGYTIGLTTIREGHDLAPALASLPGGHCSCPHWGYVTRGRLVFTFADRVEEYGAGDAF